MIGDGSDDGPAQRLGRSRSDGSERSNEQQRERATLMRYTGGDTGVLSGLMRNPNEIRMRPAIVDMPVAAGRVLLFATNPIYRWQNWGEFNMVFNALMHHNDLGAVADAKKTQTMAER